MSTTIPNHELLRFLESVMRARRGKRPPAYSAPPDATREESVLHLLRMARTKYAYQACPLAYMVWVVDGMVKRPLDNSQAVEGIRALLCNKRFKDGLSKKNQRLIYIAGQGKDAGYRLNADDNDMATAVLATDKRRARTAVHRVAQTHMMIDEAKLTLPEAQEEYEEVGGMVSALHKSGFLSLEAMTPTEIKRLNAGMAKRKKRGPKPPQKEV